MNSKDYPGRLNSDFKKLTNSTNDNNIKRASSHLEEIFSKINQKDKEDRSKDFE